MGVGILLLGMCVKQKYGSDSVFKKRTVQKFDIHSDSSDINCMQSTIQIKVNKSNFTRIKCADKERFKTTETEFSI